MVQADRSTGSTLKPLLYAAMMDAGELLPDMLVPDMPTQMAGYTPENYNEDYSGAFPAKNALARSLNIPAVRLLQQYGLEKFRDLCKTYANLASTVNHFNRTSSEYFEKGLTEPILETDRPVDFGKKSIEKTAFNAGSIYLTFEAMKEVNRPRAMNRGSSSIAVSQSLGRPAPVSVIKMPGPSASRLR